MKPLQITLRQIAIIAVWLCVGFTLTGLLIPEKHHTDWFVLVGAWIMPACGVIGVLRNRQQDWLLFGTFIMMVWGLLLPACQVARE